MNLHDLYEKYCLRLCSERKKYEPYYQEEVGICYNCRIDSFISCLEDIKNIVITKCPNCNSEKTVVIEQLDFDLLVKCQDCNLEFESAKGHD